MFGTRNFYILDFTHPLAHDGPPEGVRDEVIRPSSAGIIMNLKFQISDVGHSKVPSQSPRPQLGRTSAYIHDTYKVESRRCPESTHRAWLVGVAQESLSKMGGGQAVPCILRGKKCRQKPIRLMTVICA